MGISVDHVPCLKAWAKEIGPISLPLASDFWPHGAVATDYGVLRAEGYSERAIFLIDKDGIIRYIDVHDIDQAPDNQVVLAELRKIESGHAAETNVAGTAVESAAVEAATEGGEVRGMAVEAPAPEEVSRVTMYCRSWCPDCTRARRWFQEHDIAYREIDVEDAREAAEKIKGYNSGKLVTPTCEIDGEIVIDFDAARYGQLLGVES